MSYPLYEDIKALQKLEARLKEGKHGRKERPSREQGKDSRVQAR